MQQSLLPYNYITFHSSSCRLACSYPYSLPSYRYYLNDNPQFQETKNSDLVIISVEIGEPLDTVKPFIDKNKYNFKVLLDPDQSVASKYNIVSIPTSYFIDKDGNIVSKKMGSMNLDEMKGYIKSLDK